MALDGKIDEINYENLNYIVIDDPVTSLEEEKIISIALNIKDLIINKIGKIRDKFKDKNFGLLITTHSRLLYNVLFSEIRKDNCCFRLYKNNNGYDLMLQNDSPFGYHIEEFFCGNNKRPFFIRFYMNDRLNAHFHVGTGQTAGSVGFDLKTYSFKYGYARFLRNGFYNCVQSLK